LGLLLVGALVMWGCPAPQTPYDKANDAARELNNAARWGKMDLAQSRASRDSLDQFLRDHALWHNKIRVLDTELVGLRMLDPLHAEAQVDVEWVFDDETTLRMTRLTQSWTAVTGRWMLESEERVSGSEGLFGEEVERRARGEDAHFPTKTIR
jgi:hypothetical protein